MTIDITHCIIDTGATKSRETKYMKVVELYWHTRAFMIELELPNVLKI